MNKFKKFVCLFLAVLLVCSIPVAAFADGSNEAQTEQSIEGTTKSASAQAGEDLAKSLAGLFGAFGKGKDKPVTPTEAKPTTQKASASTTKKASAPTTTKASAQPTEKAKTSNVSSSNNVATVYFNISNANPEEPHVWLYFINESSEPINVGYYTVPVGGVVSVGAFHDRGNGDGIYYNLERYWVKDATYGRTVSMSTSVSRTELKLINIAMKYLNNWSWVFNCDWFATCIWNICSPRKLIHLGYPQITRVEMYMWGAGNLPIKISKVSNVANVYKQVDNGLVSVYPSVTYTNYGV